MVGYYPAMPNQTENDVIEAVGKETGEMLVALLDAINLLKKSLPKSEQETFNKQITKLIREPRATDMQKTVWNALKK
jgi:hypothetical protein